MGSLFGERLRALRQAARLTQEELAERAGMTAAGISAIERGIRTRTYPRTLTALADALGLTGGDREAFRALAGRVSRGGFTRSAGAPGLHGGLVAVAAARIGGARLLLVLDNCEHVVQA